MDNSYDLEENPPEFPEVVVSDGKPTGEPGPEIVIYDDPALDPEDTLDLTSGSQQANDGSPGSESADQGPRQPRPKAPGKAFSFAALLIESGLIPVDQVYAAQEAAQREKLPLGRILERDGLAMSRDLAALIAVHLGLEMVDLRNQIIEPEAIRLLPEDVARKYLVIPLRVSGDTLVVAMTDPTDLNTIQDLTVRTGYAIDPVIATPKDILEHVDLSYRLTELTQDSPEDESGTAAIELTVNKLRDARPAEVIDLLIHQALQDRASDIHIDPTESRLRIRFRIDGILHDVMNLPMEMHPTFISRLKVMSGMNIAERRRPQDGQFTVDIQNRKVDVRVAVSSTVAGEMSVLRLLDKQFTIMGLDQIGMTADNLDRYRNLLKLPYGMIVVCGPTGAGKSSTLYASILQIDRIAQNVISLEDPVEYRITDTNQMQVHAEAGITFAGQLRSILRLDPDVILVGEIRDQETAVIATQAALTGHLVLTSLHANDSVSALMRLRDLGVPPYLITASVAGIVSQRMLRVVCTACQLVTPGSSSEIEAYEAELGFTKDRFVHGAGCNICARTGYHGRTGVFEILTITDKMRQLFLSDAAREKLVAQAEEDGMVPLRRTAMLKVDDAITTPYEVMRVMFSLD